MAVERIFQQVYDALQLHGKECPMDEVVDLCPNLTWNEVFLAVDYLSRTGQIYVQLDSERTYRVQVQHAAVAEAGQVSAGRR